VPSPTWTILIPTIGQRAASFRALLDRLLPQTEPYAGRVRTLAGFNNGSPPLPELRQRMVEAVTTDYLSFADDDDMVSPDFVSEVMSALEQRPDYVGFQVNYFTDGRLRGVIDHSLKHGGWREEKNPYRWLRDITHINPIRSEVAKAARFDVVAGGQVEDRPWVEQVRVSGSLKVETYIPRPLYDYLWSRRGSAWQKPDKIRQGFTRPAISHPHFSWMELEKAVPAGRLAVIVPTRGRPENIRKVIAAWGDTNAWDCADLILAVDGDDPERDGYQEFVKPQGQIWAYEMNEWMPMVTKLNWAAQNVALAGKHFAIAFAGDDHLPRTPGWAAAYLAALRELGTDMVYGDDGYQGAKLSTEWAVTADAVRALGRMVPAPVDHLYCDNAMMDLFGGAGALRHLPEVRIEHMHPAAGKATSDAQYDRVNGREQYAGDRRKYEIWKSTNGPSRLASQIEIIRRLRGDRPVEQTRPVRATRAGRSTVRGSGPRRIERSAPTSARNAAPKSRFPFPREFREIRGATPDEIAFTLADLAKQVPADQEIVELGVFQARTAVIMAWGASLGNGAHVTAIDPWELTGNVYDPPFTDANTRAMAEYNVQSIGYQDRIQLIHGFSADVAANSDFGAPKVGLLFVDGDHTKEGARRDIEAWAPHLAPGAVIAVDDYGHPDWPGVAQAVDELVDEGFLAPIELFHDRLAVTRLTRVVENHRSEIPDLPPIAAIVNDSPASEVITAITSEGVEPEPEPEFAPLRPVETVELPDADQPDDLIGLTLGDVRKIARTMGLRPVQGGTQAVIEQIRAERARRA
jgi:predicted O-methyltransferase YrrM